MVKSSRVHAHNFDSYTVVLSFDVGLPASIGKMAMSERRSKKCGELSVLFRLQSNTTLVLTVDR
jgi:hypothetical protein